MFHKSIKVWKHKIIINGKDYLLLDLDQFASYTEIKNAYRQKILRYHPDKSHLPTSHKFIKFKRAYDNIMRSLKRGKREI